MAPYREIYLGPSVVYWLSASAPVSEQEVLGFLHDDDKAYAESLKSSARRSEFLRSRWLMAQLHLLPRSLATRSTDGVPQFAAGHLGSISHKSGQVVIATEKDRSCSSLGIDLEDTAKAHRGIAEKICTPNELALLNQLFPEENGQHSLEPQRPGPRHIPQWNIGLCTIFSFKEALFKAHYALGRTMFYFHDAEVTELPKLSPGSNIWDGTIRGKTLVTTSPLTHAGSTVTGWCRGLDNTGSATESPDFVLTLVCVP